MQQNLDIQADLVPNKQRTKVFLGGLSIQCQEEDVIKYLQQFGTVIKCKLALDDKGRKKGFGFAEFSTFAEAKQSWGFHELEGVMFQVKELQDKFKDKEHQKQIFKRKICVKQLPDEATEQDLIEVFQKFGEIEIARLLRNKKTKKSRKVAFITFLEPEAAEAAILQSEAIFVLSKNVSVELSIPKEQIKTSGENRTKNFSKTNKDSKKSTDDPPKPVLSKYGVPFYPSNLISNKNNEKAKKVLKEGVITERVYHDMTGIPKKENLGLPDYKQVDTQKVPKISNFIKKEKNETQAYFSEATKEEKTESEVNLSPGYLKDLKEFEEFKKWKKAKLLLESRAISRMNQKDFNQHKSTQPNIFRNYNNQMENHNNRSFQALRPMNSIPTSTPNYSNQSYQKFYEKWRGNPLNYSNSMPEPVKGPFFDSNLRRERNFQDLRKTPWNQNFNKDSQIKSQREGNYHVFDQNPYLRGNTQAINPGSQTYRDSNQPMRKGKYKKALEMTDSLSGVKQSSYSLFNSNQSDTKGKKDKF